MPSSSPRSGGGTRRLFRRGEPTGTGSPGAGGLRAASGRLKSYVKQFNAFVLVLQEDVGADLGVVDHVVDDAVFVRLVGGIVDLRPTGGLEPHAAEPGGHGPSTDPRGRGFLPVDFLDGFLQGRNDGGPGRGRRCRGGVLLLLDRDLYVLLPLDRVGDLPDFLRTTATS